MMQKRTTLQDELYLKNPAVIACIRGWSLLAEGYRLNVALSLHAIHMVSGPGLHSPVSLLAQISCSCCGSACHAWLHERWLSTVRGELTVLIFRHTGDFYC